MNAKKCDRCGKLYERAYVPDLTINEYIHGYGDKRYDLCDDCQRNLEKWLNSNFQNNRKREDGTI